MNFFQNTLQRKNWFKISMGKCYNNNSDKTLIQYRNVFQACLNTLTTFYIVIDMNLHPLTNGTYKTRLGDAMSDLINNMEGSMEGLVLLPPVNFITDNINKSTRSSNTAKDSYIDWIVVSPILLDLVRIIILKPLPKLDHNIMILCLRQPPDPGSSCHPS